MSQFKTVIAVPVASVLAKLPPGSFVDPHNGVRFDAESKSVVVQWEHDDYRTPYSIPVEFSEAHLDAGTCPDGVRKGEMAKTGAAERVQNEKIAKPGKVKAQRQK